MLDKDLYASMEDVRAMPQLHEGRRARNSSIGGTVTLIG
jgi:hypothetical protein